MFFLNRGPRRSFIEPIERVHGSVLLPYGNVSEKLRRMPTEAPSLLVDPQLYLAGLPATDCQKVCARLASYGWFGVPDLPAFDPQRGVRAWEFEIRTRIENLWPGCAPKDDAGISNACIEAIQFQSELRTSYIILPAPLITEREDEAASAAAWLDVGLSACEALEVEQPVLATVAIHAAALNESSFRPAGFLDAVIEQIVAREQLGGVYIVVSQEGGAEHPFETDPKVTAAYLYLVRAFAERHYEAVITNFADVFGLVCLGGGATAVASGPSQALRRLCAAGFRETGGGRTYPQYYSHPCIAEFLPESHLAAIIARSRGALRMVRDVTDYSRPLLDALERGSPAASVPAWAEGQNNVAEAHKHFIARLAEEAHAVGRLRLAAERRTHVRDWLENAADLVLLLRGRFDRDLDARFASSDEWLRILDRFA